jgi:hypothetical protein
MSIDHQGDQIPQLTANANTLVIATSEDEMRVVEDVDDNDVANVLGEIDRSTAEKVARYFEWHARFQEEVVGDHDRERDYMEVQTSKAQLDRHMTERLLEHGDGDAPEMVERMKKYTDLGSAIAWDKIDYHGRAVFLSITWPKLNWRPYRFNDRAESAMVWGVNVFHTGYWYRGDRLWLAGFPKTKFKDFSKFKMRSDPTQNHANRASSFSSLA